MINKILPLIQNTKPNIRKVLINIYWLFLDKILSIGIAFFLSVWVARYLGPSELGTLKYVNAFVFLFSPLATLGIDSIVVRELVEHPKTKYEIMGTAFFLRIICGCLTTLLIILSVSLFPPENPSVSGFISLSASIFLFKTFNVIDDWFQSQVESKYQVFSRNIILVILSIAKIIFIHYKAPLVLFIWLPVIEAALYSLLIVCFYAYRNEYRSILRWRVNLDRARYILRESLPLLFTGIAVSLYLMADQVMLGRMASEQAVGIYSVAAGLSEMWYMIPGIFSSSLYPAVIQLKQADRQLYDKRLQQYYDLMALMAYGVIFCVLPLASIVINSLYGAEYTASVPILYVHVWTCLFTFIGIAQSTWLTSEGLQKQNFIATALGAVMNILLNFWLIPKYEGMGAAIATLISYAAASYFFYLFFPATRANAMLMTNSLLLPLRGLKYGFDRLNEFSRK
jgi:polysaccharide transporter, PST family